MQPQPARSCDFTNSSERCCPAAEPADASFQGVLLSQAPLPPLLAAAGWTLPAAAAEISQLHADQLRLLTLMDGARALLHDAAGLDLHRQNDKRV